jgi:hypothetical protein
MSQNEYALLSEQISGLTKLTNAQFINVNERLDKINGSVAKHEAQINEALIERAKNREAQSHVIETHILNCPQGKRIETLEKYQLENSVTKKFVMKAVGIGMALPATIWAIVQILSKLL